MTDLKKDPIKLEDIVPQASSFKLAKTGKDYKLRAVTLEDELWLNREFGSSLDRVFQEIEMASICRIVWRLMEEEDKADFAVKTVTIMNEHGEKVSEKKGGAQLLLCYITGFKEKMDIFHALLQTIGISRPMVEKMAADEEKKSQDSPPIGEKSSTSSATNMDGQPSTSSPEPLEKSRSDSKQ